jgi:hypothetical protein
MLLLKHRRVNPHSHSVPQDPFQSSFPLSDSVKMQIHIPWRYSLGTMGTTLDRRFTVYIHIPGGSNPSQRMSKLRVHHSRSVHSCRPYSMRSP